MPAPECRSRAETKGKIRDILLSVNTKKQYIVFQEREIREDYKE